MFSWKIDHNHPLILTSLSSIAFSPIPSSIISTAFDPSSMKLTLVSSLLVIAAGQVAAQFYVDYYDIASNYNSCSGDHYGCDNIPTGDCCELNQWSPFFPTANVGSYGPAGFVVWTNTDDFGTYCGTCAVTSSFGCFNNENPFQTAFVVGLPVSCTFGKLRRATEMAGAGSDAGGSNTTAADAPGTAPGCENSVKPNKVSVNGRDYNVTDDNRDEIVADFLNRNQVNFAEKWKAFYRGETDRPNAAAGQTAQNKGESS
ncbi:hypothetical protein QBC46DRAFT_401433 [Diplogelasinospora grovesii]|uniref:Uncharacterized protein n=1 Tax=Diplogelasinospora grovesii TaxID=303347 RepID=A0AAN6MUH4_9PEZI|nr:hypothetical protein QBC46DRAFT_401433 [Diplogelasinospora grovesii]